MENSDICADCANPAGCYSSGRCHLASAKVKADDRLGGTTCSPSSDTPETDTYAFTAEDVDGIVMEIIDAGYARKLERERDDKTALAMGFAGELAELRNAVREYRDAKGRFHTQKACERLLSLLPENAEL